MILGGCLISSISSTLTTGELGIDLLSLSTTDRLRKGSMSESLEARDQSVSCSPLIMSLVTMLRLSSFELLESEDMLLAVTGAAGVGILSDDSDNYHLQRSEAGL